MNRRKFLNLGGLSLLGLNTVWGVVASRFKISDLSVSERFLHWIQANKIQIDEKTENNFLQSASFFTLSKIGYHWEHKNTFEKGDFLCFVMELKSNHTMYDQIILMAPKDEISGSLKTLSARQMFWLLDSQHDLEKLAIVENVDLTEVLLPVRSSQSYDSGILCYHTGTGYIGFNEVMSGDTVKIRGIIKNKKGEVIINKVIETRFYPEVIEL